MPSQNNWDSIWLNIALCVSKLSKDPSTKVGAVIVTKDNRQCSLGYNGFAKGLEDEIPESWERPLKYEKVIHAEINAIMNCPFDTHGCILYCTHQPCHRCLAHLVNSGINKVIFLHKYENLQYKDIWKETSELFDTIYQFDIETNKRNYKDLT